MKINNCKLCETYDDQKLSGDKNAHCRHTSAAAAFISPNHIRDFLAFHLLRGNYEVCNFTRPSNWCVSNHDFDLNKERTIKEKNHDDHWPYMCLQRAPKTELTISIIRDFVKRKSLFLSPSYKCLSFSFPNNFLHTHSSAFECFFIFRLRCKFIQWYWLMFMNKEVSLKSWGVI